MESARRAGTEDLPAVIDLAHEGHAELRPNRGGSVWAVREGRQEPMDADLEAAVTGQDGRVAVVGLIDSVVVGYATMHFEVLHDDSTLAVVTDLFVTEQARGVGVGEVMMDLLIAEATVAGAFGIDALALPGDRETKNFFERFGLTARAILVHRSLAPAGEAGASTIEVPE